MTVSLTYAKTISGQGSTLGQSVTRSGSAIKQLNVSLPVGAAGQLTTRTSDTVGELTMTSGSHGISTSDVIDIFWSGGRRYGVTVGTVSGTAVPISSGSGDVLPSTSTAVVATIQVTANIDIDGDNVALLGIVMVLPDGDDADGHIQLKDSGASEIAAIDLTARTVAAYDITGGDTNVFTGNPITNIAAANGSSTNAATLQILSLEEAQP